MRHFRQARTRRAGARRANGTAAHALDFTTCASCRSPIRAPLVPAILAAAELTGAGGRAVLDVRGRFRTRSATRQRDEPAPLPARMALHIHDRNPGAAAAVSRVCSAQRRAGHALAIAASEASGLKENFGTMVKPPRDSGAQRRARRAAREGRHDGERARDRRASGPLHVMDARSRARRRDRGPGSRWEILDTGITVKLYPVAGTIPRSTRLWIRRREGFTADEASG